MVRGCVAVLRHPWPFTLQPEDAEFVNVAHFVGRGQEGADWRKGVAALALVPGAATLQLKLALRHVVV